MLYTEVQEVLMTYRKKQEENNIGFSVPLLPFFGTLENVSHSQFMGSPTSGTRLVLAFWWQFFY